MAVFSSDYAPKPAVTGFDSASSDCTIRARAVVPATYALNDLFKMVKLPAGATLIDAWMACSDIDTNGSPLVSLTLAVLNVGLTDIEAGTNLITASTIGRTGGFARADLLTGLTLAPYSVDRWIGVKVAAAGATPALGQLDVAVTYNFA